MSVLLCGYVSHFHLYGHLSFWDVMQTPQCLQNMLEALKEAPPFS